MKKISTIGVDNVIEYINNRSIIDKYFRPQIEIIDKNKMSNFLLFCENLSSISRIDELGGRENIRRYPIDKELNDIIYKADTSIVCGIKVVKTPLMNIMEYESWNDGYIEGFARMDSDVKRIEWFSWQYIKMKHLKTILEEFKNDLYLL